MLKLVNPYNTKQGKLHLQTCTREYLCGDRTRVLKTFPYSSKITSFPCTQVLQGSIIHQQQQAREYNRQSDGKNLWIQISTGESLKKKF